MDPFSITASIVTLIQVSAQVTVLVKQFRDEVNVVDTTLSGILNDVDGFQQVLQSMKETFAQEDIQADVHATGHVGSHWKNLARSLSDSESTLDQLRSLLASVNKSTSFLDASRKQLRLKSAIVQISGFREQIQSYRAALQLSLSTIMVWNQVTLQKSTAKLPEKIMPDLNRLSDQIRTLGAELNAKIGRLENTVANQGFHAESELISMTNLKECVLSAADVVSTASTTLGPEGSERASVKYGSDFGDIFRRQSNEPMQRWMSSHTVYEYDDVEAPTHDPSEASTGDALTLYESDSDSDIEHELVRALFINGKKRKEEGDLHGAERHLRNCLSRFPSTASYTSLTSSQNSFTTSISKAELLEILTETYCMQGSWKQAKSTMKEKLAITERQTGKKSERFLWDSFRLCEVLMNTKDYTEAQLHGRQALRGFRKLREQGHAGYEKTLALLIQICNEQGNLEDEEAYAALLGSYQANFRTPEGSSKTDSGAKEKSVGPVSDREAQATTPEQSSKGSVHGSKESATSRHIGGGTGKQLQREEPIRPESRPQVNEVPCSLESSGVAESRIAKTQPAKPLKVDSPMPNETSLNETRGSSSPKRAATVSKDALACQQTLLKAGHVNNGDNSSTKLLISLCQQELGRKPIFMIGRGREGYNCIVFADEGRTREIAKVADYLTKEEARHAAAAKAYKTLVSQPTRSADSSPASKPLSGKPKHERLESAPKDDDIDDTAAINAHADPPAYTPIDNPHLTSPTGFLQDIPEIMVSPTLNEPIIARPKTLSPAQSFPVRRAASDSRLPSYKATANVSTLTAASSSVIDPRRLNDAFATNALPAHRRAASTSSRFPDRKAADNMAIPQPTGFRTTSIKEEPKLAGHVRNAQPNVTFDTIESSVERPNHSNQDTHMQSPRGFSLLPASLAKTFSLQDRRSKSDDPTLTKKKSRFGLSTRRKSPTSTSASLGADGVSVAASSHICPICHASLQGLNDDEAWSHVDSCLDKPNSPLPSMAYELPVPEHNFYAVELPASVPETSRANQPTSPISSNQSPIALSDLHRAFSRRDLSAGKFEIEEEARLDLPTPMSPLSQFEANPMQRQVLLLGDVQCGKTWLSHAWCRGSIPKHTSLSATSFTKRMASLDIVVQDYSGLHRVPDQERRASYGVVHAVLLCFDISSPGSFENVEHKWNYEADLYLNKVPKILVGCKKDINRGGSQTVWTRDAYKLTARINARAYFETSAVTMEGLDVLFEHVAQIAPR
ncbi:alpha-ketoglutarate dehydrogenase complex subunit [Stagonosporopsis vannaccii]|nr:alpha-ketoglutarate dehydrogenase complex subunit [Stagonosporopsis vannaccii]